MRENAVYEFASFKLDTARRVLDSAGESIAIPPKAFDALVFLIEHRDHVVKKDELVRALWPDVAVQDSSLTQLIFLLRRALDYKGDGSEYIATASRYGYRFVAPITIANGAERTVPTDRDVRRPISSRMVVAVTLVALALVGFIAGFAHRERTSSEARPIRMFIRPPENTLPSVLDDVESPPSLSRDGRTVAFVARALDGRTVLWVRPLDTLTARPLAGTEDAAPASVFWSPDGRSLAFVAQNQLKRVDVAAGTTQVLVQEAFPRRGSWDAAGTILFSRFEGLYRVSASGGVPSVVLAAKGDELLSYPSLLPDRKHFLFLRKRSDRTWSEVRVGATDSGETRELLSGPDLSAAHYAPPFLLFMRGGRLQAQRFDAATLTLSGEAWSLAEQVSHNDDGYAAMSVSDSGVLAYRTGISPRTHLTWFDRTGRRLAQLDTPPGHIFNYHISSDGRYVTALIGPRAKDELWLLSTSGSPPRRLPYPAGHLGGAVWSPDGSEIAFLFEDGKQGGTALIRHSVISTSDEVLLRSSHFVGVTDWSSDGRSLIVQFEDTKLIPHIWTLLRFGDRRPALLVDTGNVDGQGQLSPDGQWLAYKSRQSGRDEVYVKHFLGKEPAWQISTNGGNSPRWRRDGKELFYLQNDRSLMAVTVDDSGSDLKVRPPQRLFDVHARICGCFNFVPSVDGQRFLINAFPNTGESQPLVVVLNWAADRNN